MNLVSLFVPLNFTPISSHHSNPDFRKVATHTKHALHTHTYIHIHTYTHRYTHTHRKHCLSSITVLFKID